MYSIEQVALVEASLKEWQADLSMKAKLEQAGFGVVVCNSVESCMAAIEQQQCKTVVIDDHLPPSELHAYVQAIRNFEEHADIPIALMGNDNHLDKRMQSVESGFDDYFLMDISADMLQHRLQRLHINKVANHQLKSQPHTNKEVAFIGWSNSSHWGVNIQFMLDCHRCDNLDELGMLFFQALQHYGVHGSLQMRSQYGLKNMEANGLAKHLESTLLWELKSQGPCVDFGRRSILNYEKVSLLIKNMPKDEPSRCGTLKDNVFPLLQAIDARITAIDNGRLLQLEKELVGLMSARILKLEQGKDQSYQWMIKDIAKVIEEMSERVRQLIVVCALHEDQEMAFEKIIEKAIAEMEEVFAKIQMNDRKTKEFVSSIEQSRVSQHDDLTPMQLINMIKEFKNDLPLAG